MTKSTVSKAAKKNAEKSVRAYEAVVLKIKKLITKGNLGPGDLLPPERQLADQFKVSRHSLREAIRVLQEQGILAARQGSGNYVQASSRADLIRALNFSASTTANKIAELFQIREIIEPKIAGLAAENVTDEQLQIIQDITDRLVEADDFQLGQELDHEFHEAIAAATGNEYLFNMLREINKNMLPTASTKAEKLRRQTVSNDGHANILKALFERNPIAAEIAMREHINQIKKEIIS